MIEQRRTHTQRRLAPHLNNLRLPYAVPVLQGRFHVALKEINGGKEFVSVGIFGIETQRAMQIASGLSIFLLLERDSRQFDGKALIIWRELFAGQQRFARLVPPLQMRQSNAVVIIEIGGGAGNVFQEQYQFRPALLFKKLFRQRRIGSLRVRGETAQCYQDSHQITNQMRRGSFIWIQTAVVET